MNVGIFGTSYCGSTLLSYIFSKHSNVFSVGESHWLIDKHPRIYQDKNFAHCTICREKPDKKCDFFTPDFIESLTFDNIVNKIALKAQEEYQTTHVLYSDKHPYNYNRMFKTEKMDKAIILFKRPEGFIHSFLRHDKIFHKERTEKQIFNCGINAYYKINNENVQWINKRNIPVIFIFLEDFTENPEKIIQHLCCFLNIPYEANLTKYWEDNKKFHQIGGNGSPKISIFNDGRIKREYGGDTEINKWYRSIRKNIVFDQRWKKLDKAYLDILKNDRCQQVFKNLMEKRTYD